MKTINKVLSNFKDTPDLIVRKIKYKLGYVYIYYIETISSSDRVNSFILDNLTNPVNKPSIDNILAGPNLKKIKITEFEKYIFNGYSIIVYFNKLYALETRADLDRAISSPEIEQEVLDAESLLQEDNASAVTATAEPFRKTRRENTD